MTQVQKHTNMNKNLDWNFSF